MSPLLPINPVRDDVPLLCLPAPDEPLIPFNAYQSLKKTSNRLISKRPLFREQSVRLVFFSPPKRLCLVLGLPVLYRNDRQIKLYTKINFVRTISNIMQEI